MIPGSANRKIVQVNNEQGAKNINQQQGTTRAIYDSIKLVNGINPKQTLRFFENVNTKVFPLTNLSENKLQIGESIALQRYNFSIVGINNVSGAVLTIEPLDNVPAGFQGIYKSDMSISIAQDQIIKKLPLSTMYGPFNKKANFYGNQQVNPGTPGLWADLGKPHDVGHFDNPIIIPPQIEFYVDLQVPTLNLTLNAFADYYLVCTLEGLGSLYAPKATY